MRAKASALILVLATAFVMVACGSHSPPSREECIGRWSLLENRQSQAAIAGLGFPHAFVSGWPSKAGDHCSATFFTRRGQPWVMFVLWIDAPNPTTRFGRDIGGSRYGEGQLGAERPIPPNAHVQPDGTLIDPAVTP